MYNNKNACCKLITLYYIKVRHQQWMQQQQFVIDTHHQNN